MKKLISVLGILCAFFLTPAEARQRHSAVRTAAVTPAGNSDVADYSHVRARARVSLREVPVRSYTPRIHRHLRHRDYTPRIAVAHNAQMLSHPSGCPGRAFCGCGAAVEVFGTPRRDLWLASNWLKFPRTSPAPGMVAARRGHVFVLKQQVADGSWLVADFNSGGHASRLHVRPLGGYTIVNPHG